MISRRDQASGGGVWVRLTAISAPGDALPAAGKSITSEQND